MLFLVWLMIFERVRTLKIPPSAQDIQDVCGVLAFANVCPGGLVTISILTNSPCEDTYNSISGIQKLITSQGVNL